MRNSQSDESKMTLSWRGGEEEEEEQLLPNQTRFSLSRLVTPDESSVLCMTDGYKGLCLIH